MSTTTQTTTDAPAYIPTLADAKRFATRALREGRAVPPIYEKRLEEAGIDLNSLLEPPATKATPATTKGDRQLTASDFIPKSVSGRRRNSDGRHVGTGLSRFSGSH